MIDFRILQTYNSRDVTVVTYNWDSFFEEIGDEKWIL